MVEGHPNPRARKMECEEKKCNDCNALMFQVHSPPKRRHRSKNKTLGYKSEPVQA